MTEYNKAYVNRILKKAITFKKFFDNVLSSGNDPKEIATYMVLQDKINADLRLELMSVANDVSKANKLIYHLVDFYGLGKKGKENRSDELLMEVMFKKIPKSQIIPKGYSFAIGLEIPGKYMEKGTDGSTMGGASMHEALEHNIAQIESGKSDFKQLYLFTLIVNKDARNLDATRKHELKHLTDNYISDSSFHLIETSAYLYHGQLFTKEENDDIIKKRRDLYDMKERLQQIIDPMLEKGRTLEDLRSVSVFGDTIEYLERKINQFESELGLIESFPFEILQEIHNSGKCPAKVLSYVIPIVPHEELAPSLEAILKYGKKWEKN